MSGEYFCFTVEKTRLGIPLKDIDRVISAVAVSHIPNSPSLIHGLIDFYGTLVPILNLRHRLNFKEIAISPDQFFIVINTTLRKLVLVADSIQGLISFQTSGIIPARSYDEDFEPIHVYRTDEGIILIYDTEKFLKGEDILQFELDANPNPIQVLSDPLM